MRAEVSWAGSWSQARQLLLTLGSQGLINPRRERRGHTSLRKTRNACVPRAFLDLASHFIQSSTLFLRQCPSLRLEHTELTSLTGWKAWTSSCFAPIVLGL